MASIDAGRQSAPKVPFFNDPKIRGIVYQIAVALAVVLFVSWVIHNTAANLAAQNKATGFDFLWGTAGFEVSFTLTGFNRSSLYWQALVTGLASTILVSIIAIFVASIVGFTLGIARLSNNWIISRLATVYVELVRNVPLLLQLFIWYFAVLKAMPAVKQSLVFFGGWALNQRGLYVPKPLVDDRFFIFAIAVVVAIVAIVLVRRWARERLFATGKQFPVTLTSLTILIVLPFLAFVISGTQVEFQTPVLQGFNYRGGIQLPPELVALIVGLSLYHATFIGETVRGGIVAISHGQTEAAQSLGLDNGQRLRLVVIPQALRVIIPPMTSQYLNIIKNSSLGAAIGYPEFVSVFMGTSLNQAGRAIEIISITMLVYLTLSLSTSALMNWYNARVALVER
ncbi:amino acid ABC transporter permease [uncultured Devosia sp.]|uniref:amino acid ABC transporter permease n=1 Tax=uncultured Devosia sp. TaxID=211434 RepID=UPI0035CABEBE